MDDPKETGRVESFSDGVFAVAITLLVLNLQLPPKTYDAAQLGQYFLSQVPMFLAFVTSFATIGVMWINHHRLFTHITHIDTTLMLFNLLLLLIIIFVPFPTAFLAQSFTNPEQQRIAALLYNGVSIVMAICFNLVWGYAAKDNRLLGKNTSREDAQAITDQYRFGPLFYVVTFAIAWISVPVSIVGILLLAIFFALPFRSTKSRSKSDSSLATKQTSSADEQGMREAES